MRTIALHSGPPAHPLLRLRPLIPRKSPQCLLWPKALPWPLLPLPPPLPLPLPLLPLPLPVAPLLPLPLPEFPLPELPLPLLPLPELVLPPEFPLPPPEPSLDAPAVVAAIVVLVADELVLPAVTPLLVVTAVWTGLLDAVVFAFESLQTVSVLARALPPCRGGPPPRGSPCVALWTFSLTSPSGLEIRTTPGFAAPALAASGLAA